jgi:hypothetical protein
MHTLTKYSHVNCEKVREEIGTSFSGPCFAYWIGIPFGPDTLPQLRYRGFKFADITVGKWSS